MCGRSSHTPSPRLRSDCRIGRGVVRRDVSRFVHDKVLAILERSHSATLRDTSAAARCRATRRESVSVSHRILLVTVRPVYGIHANATVASRRDIARSKFGRPEPRSASKPDRRDLFGATHGHRSAIGRCPAILTVGNRLSAGASRIHPEIIVRLWRRVLHGGIHMLSRSAHVSDLRHTSRSSPNA